LKFLNEERDIDIPEQPSHAEIIQIISIINPDKKDTTTFTILLHGKKPHNLLYNQYMTHWK
jgi:hypothetical protein